MAVEKKQDAILQSELCELQTGSFLSTEVIDYLHSFMYVFVY